MMTSQTHLSDQEQIDRANATGRIPVVFIHGLWLLPSSWDRWAEVFDQAGYKALPPGGPADPVTTGGGTTQPHASESAERSPTPGRGLSDDWIVTPPSSATPSAACSHR